MPLLCTLTDSPSLPPLSPSTKSLPLLFSIPLFVILLWIKRNLSLLLKSHSIKTHTLLHPHTHTHLHTPTYTHIYILPHTHVYSHTHTYTTDESQYITCGSNHKISYWDACDAQSLRVIDGSESQPMSRWGCAVLYCTLLYSTLLYCIMPWCKCVVLQ